MFSRGRTTDTSGSGIDPIKFSQKRLAIDWPSIEVLTNYPSLGGKMRRRELIKVKFLDILRFVSSRNTGWSRSKTALASENKAVGKTSALGNIRAFCRRLHQVVSEFVVASVAVRHIRDCAAFLKTWTAQKPYGRDKQRYAKCH